MSKRILKTFICPSIVLISPQCKTTVTKYSNNVNACAVIRLLQQQASLLICSSGSSWNVAHCIAVLLPLKAGNTLQRD